MKEVKCKRGHRVDQVRFEDFEGTQTLSHQGHAGGGWRNNDQIVKLDSDEYLRRVDAYHITAGYVKGQLAKIVYFTSKDRIISCYYNKVKYTTEKKTFAAPTGQYIQSLSQYQDPKKCCGRVTDIVTEPFV